MTLPAFIAKRRGELRITQEELEERTGLRQSYLSQLERGIIKNPRGRNLELLARGLECSVDDLKVAMGYVVQVDREVKFTSESNLSAEGKVTHGASQPPLDPRQRLFLKKATEGEFTDDQWERLLAILDEDDDSER